MKVQGITVLTRKVIVTRRFGSDAWARLFRDVASAHPCFLAPITSNTFVPLPAYLAFHDELVRRFYGEGDEAHAEVGRESARWALTEGPFKQFMAKRDIKQLVASLPTLWKMYFSETDSWTDSKYDGSTIDLKVLDLPQWHPYLEHFLMGYMKELFDLFCANPMTATRLRGGGGKDYHYLLHAGPGAVPETARKAAARAAANVRDAPAKEQPAPLSDREIEVLRFVAEGKTNKEIGGVLGISSKTVQHHVASVYSKLGVTGRVGAAMWLARRGLIGGR